MHARACHCGGSEASELILRCLGIGIRRPLGHITEFYLATYVWTDARHS